MLALLRERLGVLPHLFKKPSHLGVTPAVSALKALQSVGVALMINEKKREGEKSAKRVFARSKHPEAGRDEGGGVREGMCDEGDSRACHEYVGNSLDAWLSKPCQREGSDATYRSRLGSALVPHRVVSTNFAVCLERWMGASRSVRRQKLHSGRT